MRPYIHPYTSFLFTLGAIILMSTVLVSCFENPERPAVVTKEISGVTSISFKTGGTITSDGGADIIQKGVCIGTFPNPTISSGATQEGPGSGSFTSEVFIGSNVTYYIRAYAVSTGGIAYGNDVTFSAVGVSLVDIGDITGNTAFLRGNVFSDSQISERGFCWSTNANPTIADSKLAVGSGAGQYEATISGLAPGTSYYVRPYAIGVSGTFYGDFALFATKNLPGVVTQEINNANTFIPTTGGKILSTGDAQITAVGVCWSKTPGPTLADSKTEDYLLYDDFTSEPSGLQPGETYYIRAYATNIAGTNYGNELMITMPAAAITDVDGNHYTATTILSQVWTVENLRTTKFANGESIQNITDMESWRNATGPAWSYYENDATFNHPFGKLYNWYAVSDARNLCPTGWHTPSEEEWTTLFSVLGGEGDAGRYLKERGTVHWLTTDPSVTNELRFTALPGGAKSATSFSYPMGVLGLFWSSTARTDESARGYYLVNYNSSVGSPQLPDFKKQAGHSVRCVKD